VRRISDQTAAVLRLFLDHATDDLFGLQIIKAAGIPSGSLYPILHRLEDRKILRAQWEPMEVAVAEMRRPRRIYRLDPASAADAADLLSAWEHQGRRVSKTAGSAPLRTRPV
jgi:PadR family transcriptional regulator PadR